MNQIISLNGSDWRFKEFYGEDWNWRKSYLPDTTDVRWWRRGSVPGSPHHDLWQLGEIPNPYIERNTLQCEWVSARTWLYKKSFQVDENLRGARILLHFKGVDYAAHFYLNDAYLGHHVGMYTPVVFDVTDWLQYGAENTLSVVIEAAPQEQPQVGYTSRVQTHKSRMTYWWDFCPRLVHQGIWDDVYLEVSGPVRCDGLFVRPVLSEDYESVDILVSGELDAVSVVDAELEVVLRLQGDVLAAFRKGLTTPVGQTPLEFQMNVADPQLWWPNGYGEQPLYELDVTLKVAGRTSYQQKIPFGIRQIELVANQDADPAALPYTLVVNGRKMYIKGWNWVPIDIMYSVPRPEKLAHLLTLAQRAHVNMLRVWGGGLIEKDAFYEQCDRLGILVWQEFIQSSSGIDNEPSTAPEFIEMLVNDAEQIIPLKRNHPSLAIWCGGNELQSGSEQPLDDAHPTLSALKEVINRLDPDRIWLPTSSSGAVFSNSLENIHNDPGALHDVHGPWEYQGVTQQYELYNQGASLLHSEFGVEGITNLKTLNATISPQHQWPVSLDTNPYWWHLGAWWVRRVVWDQVFGKLPDVETYVQATQFTQFEGLRYAVEADRRRKYHNSGTLPWQFNEPFPMAACTSAVDYYGHPKPVYHAILEAYAPIHISAQYPTLGWAGRDQFEAQIWVNNSHVSNFADLLLEIRLVGVSGKVVAERDEKVSFRANGSTRLLKFSAALEAVEDVFFLDLKLSDSQKVRSANRYLFTRTENIRPILEQPHTTVTMQEMRHGDQVEIALTNTGEVTAMYLWLEDGREVTAPGALYFDQNYFCLFPGETFQANAAWHNVPEAERKIQISGWNTSQIR